MNRKERDFVNEVWTYYRKEGRHTLPWRKTRNSYRILVSEVMLQQTQVERVIPKYREFLTQFPTVHALAGAPLRDVLRAWQGLGYNRRAKMLHETARAITQKFRGRTPKSYEELKSLPGVGPYTAGAVMAFAHNTPVPLIETNIRTVFIHHFFGDRDDVEDREIVRYIERTLDRENPREWYYALMDYGAHLKRTVGNEGVRSRHYTKQSTFKNSDRQIRGAIIRALTVRGETRKVLHAKLPFDPQRIDEQIERLLGEEMIAKRNRVYTLPGS